VHARSAWLDSVGRMGSEATLSHLAEILPGRWTIRATNLWHWLNGERLNPVVELRLNSAEPLVLAEQVEFATNEGKGHVVRSHSVWNGSTFVTRKLGIRRPRARRWIMSGASKDGNVIVVKHGSGRSASDGIDVLVREGSDVREVRALVASESERFRLSLEDFASLNWFPGQA
jgi:hypothetical protein